eukprot:gene1040-15369_t
MPALGQWDPQSAVLEWIKAKARRNREGPNGKQQEYFKGVFKEASIEHKEALSVDEEN